LTRNPGVNNINEFYGKNITNQSVVY